MNNYGITVPQKIVTFSVPYSSFDFGETQKQLKLALKLYTSGLSDAVGNYKFISDLQKAPIYPNTCAMQDAAPNNPAEATITVTEDTVVPKVPETHPEHRYTIRTPGGLFTFNIEPQRFGDISIFSFYPNKHITTGEGGMIVTNDSNQL
jgi:hypothetical protein